MSSIESVWYAFVAVSCVMVLVDRRHGIFLGIVIDVLRDPVRKLAPEQPVMITLSGVVFWLVFLFTLLLANQKSVRDLFRQYPGLRTAGQLGMLALLPAAALSMISYHRGWVIAAIGMASYIVPALGIAAGYVLVRREAEILRIFAFYICINSLALVSVPFEFAKIDVPALGGIDNHWIRYHGDKVVDLMSGWYRSPDIMGLHAAQVAMFSLLLAIRSTGTGRTGWIPSLLWAMFCLFVSGRRKMMGIPVIFFGVFLTLGLFYRLTKMNRFAGAVLVGAAMGVAALAFIWSPDEESEYTDYASTLFTGGLERSQAFIDGPIGTLQQSGFLGAGLGSATQGRYYTNVEVNSRAGWQEDAVSRLFVEFGVPGVVLVFFALWQIFKTLRAAMKSVSRSSELALVQVGLASIVVGNAASFAVSHQQFSGDPVNGLFVTLIIGMILKLPVLVSQRTLSVTAAGSLLPNLRAVGPRASNY